MRLISFLGVNQYEPTHYRWAQSGASCFSRYVALALAQILEAHEVVVLATEKAEASHGQALTEAFTQAGLAQPRFERILDGKSSEELWENFNHLSELLHAGRGEETVLDITHSFRSLPFFAGAVVAFVRTVASQQPVRIVYGAFEARSKENITPVWDLTPFVDLLDWTQALDLFLRTGQADMLADKAEALGRRLAREWASSKAESSPPRIRNFAKMIRFFAEALATVRVGELLLSSGKPGSLARQLQNELALARKDIVEYLPPVAQVFERLEAMIAPLVIDTDHLSGKEGQKAMAALARLYLQLGRYAETGIVLREGWVSRFAPPSATRPGPDFDDQARLRAERELTTDPGRIRQLMALRNDIEHGGFRKKPLSASSIRDQLKQFVEDFTAYDDVERSDQEHQREMHERSSGRPATYFVTRHPGAVEWAARQGLVVDHKLDHLDVSIIQPGDTVIGILPVNLAAEVCARGGRFFNLSLTVPPEARGRELSADELEQFGARLEEYRVERVA